jgi:hypothetical protein
VVGSSCGGRSASTVGEFPTDYISRAGRKIGLCVEFFEEPTVSDRANGDRRVRRMRRLGEEHPVERETGKIEGDGGVMACKEARVDRSSRKVGGPS